MNSGRSLGCAAGAAFCCGRTESGATTTDGGRGCADSGGNAGGRAFGVATPPERGVGSDESGSRNDSTGNAGGRALLGLLAGAGESARAWRDAGIVAEEMLAPTAAVGVTATSL